MAKWTKILTTTGAACLLAGAAFAQQSVPVPDESPSVSSEDREPTIPAPDQQIDPAPDPVITYNQDRDGVKGSEHRSKADRDEHSRLGINSQQGGPMQPIADTEPGHSDPGGRQASTNQ